MKWGGHTVRSCGGPRVLGKKTQIPITHWAWCVRTSDPRCAWGWHKLLGHRGIRALAETSVLNDECMGRTPLCVHCFWKNMLLKERCISLNGKGLRENAKCLAPFQNLSIFQPRTGMWMWAHFWIYCKLVISARVKWNAVFFIHMNLFESSNSLFKCTFWHKEPSRHC